MFPFSRTFLPVYKSSTQCHTRNKQPLIQTMKQVVRRLFLQDLTQQVHEIACMRSTRDRSGTCAWHLPTPPRSRNRQACEPGAGEKVCRITWRTLSTPPCADSPTWCCRPSSSRRCEFHHARGLRGASWYKSNKLLTHGTPRCPLSALSQTGLQQSKSKV